MKKCPNQFRNFAKYCRCINNIIEPPHKVVLTKTPYSPEEDGPSNFMKTYFKTSQ